MNALAGISDTLQSERGVFCILTLLCATTLTIFGQLTIEQWLDLVKWLTGFFVASKTVTTAVETYALKKTQIPKADVVESKE